MYSVYIFAASKSVSKSPKPSSASRSMGRGGSLPVNLHTDPDIQILETPSNHHSGGSAAAKNASRGKNAPGSALARSLTIGSQAVHDAVQSLGAAEEFQFDDEAQDTDEPTAEMQDHM